MGKSSAGVQWDWKRFDKEIRPSTRRLLKRLPDFDRAILVGGCQRSGTTMLNKVLASSEGMAQYWFGKWPELDAALILSGEVDHEPSGRYVFQTTYLDDRYREYLEPDGRFHLLWVIRDPRSIVTSMLYNWPAFALRDTFRRCGSELLEGRVRTTLYRALGTRTVPALDRACLTINRKAQQLLELRQRMEPEKLLVVDYDHLTEHKDRDLPLVYEFLDQPYRAEYGEPIHARSRKKAERLSSSQVQRVEELCSDLHRTVRALAFNAHSSA